MSDVATHSPWPKAIGVAIAAAGAICLILLAFSWPALTAEPRDVPVAITGQSELVDQVESAIDASAADAIELIPVDDRAEAVTAIEEREVVGGLVLDPAAPEVLTASAAGSGPQQVMTRLADMLQARTAQAAQQQPDQPPAGEPRAAPPELRITDVVPLSDDDPTGARFTVTALPLVIGGLLGGAVIGFALTGIGRQLVAVSGYALVGGFALGAILQFWYGALSGPYGLNSLALTLALLAIAATVLGLVRLMGAPGAALAAVFFVLVGTPISGATIPREFLPGPWDAIGQWLPSGATSNLLRNLSYFPDASTTGGWLILGGWVVIGFLLVLLSALRRNQAITPVSAPPTDSNSASHVDPDDSAAEPPKKVSARFSRSRS